MELHIPPAAEGSLNVSPREAETQSDPTVETLYKFVSFYFGETHYAVPARSVAEVTGHLMPTPLPDGPGPLSGIAPHRGDILAIVNTGVAAGSGDPAKRKAVVLRPIGDKVELPIAFNVDRIGEMLQIRAEDLRHASIDDPLGEFEASVNGQPVLIVDPSRIADLLTL
ncbi:MAG: chemotaxis protein CheW [bacterium]|nr:chemotaxis protein CheW [bacterium]